MLKKGIESRELTVELAPIVPNIGFVPRGKEVRETKGLLCLVVPSSRDITKQSSSSAMANVQLKSACREKKYACQHTAIRPAPIGCLHRSNWGIMRREMPGILCVFGALSVFLGFLVAVSGCSAIPDFRKKPTYHNPFPQISRIAILPFRNQSEEPTLSGFRVSQAYYNELQSVAGFEVLPLGVVENQMADFEQQVLRRPIATSQDFQEFAQFLGVDAVLQGAITDYSPYYPPRMTLKVNWYAANEGFHPIPVGYGLPWGTKQEKKIPSWIKLESERALAKEQLATQTPLDEAALEGPTLERESSRTGAAKSSVVIAEEVRFASFENRPEPKSGGEELPLPSVHIGRGTEEDYALAEVGLPNEIADEMPVDWPDPRGFIPARPVGVRPPLLPQHEPIISHMKAYNGNDEDFTHALQEYFYFRDDARFGGWQSYLQRSEDFIRFCCHLHIAETLSARGGLLESRMNLRWPTYRYER